MNRPTTRPSGRKPDIALGDNDWFTAFRRELDRLFESFGRDLAWPGGESRGAARAPSIDVSETESELRIEADLPGVEEKDVDVTVSDNVLTIKGEKKAEKEEKNKDFHLVERSYGSFSRSLTLPFAADPSKAKATFKNGVLSISLPKPPEVKAKAKKIAIGSR
ncbi:MAG: Hsp20/alpha crystallin family protein [Geminicoccaceae bacterium]